MLILHDTTTGHTYRLGNFGPLRAGGTHISIEDDGAPYIMTIESDQPSDFPGPGFEDVGSFELDRITLAPEDPHRMRMARAMNYEIEQMREFFVGWEQRENDWTISEQDLARWLKDQYPRVSRIWRRIVEGYVILLNNAADPNAATLEWKPELKLWFALANHIKELETNNA